MVIRRLHIYTSLWNDGMQCQIQTFLMCIINLKLFIFIDIS